MLAPLASAQTFNDLYNFMRGQDGGDPWSTPIRDAAGNLYGTTYAGGNFDSSGICNYAGCGVVADAAGDLYGTTAYGGTNGYGTMFVIEAAVGKGF
jgi:uncharacterized repeat protein (TIGR03803 family)